MTKKLYEENQYQKEFEATVQEIDGKKVVLDQTCFFVEGCGQAGDTGKLNGVEVMQTQKIQGKHVHMLKEEPTFKVGEKVKGVIDWERRYKIMRLHGTSHIVEYFLHKIVGNITLGRSFVSNKVCKETYALNNVPLKEVQEKRKEVEDAVNAFLAEDHKVFFEFDKKDPTYRWWVCEDIRVGCGGTHVKNTQEIKKINITIEEKDPTHIKVESRLSD